MQVKLVSRTTVEPEYVQDVLANNPDIPLDFANILNTPEGLMAFTARVSSPNQTNPSFEHLLTYCIQNSHWSVFELVDCTFEILTSRAIAQQIIRHRSFCFQEFSQRYSKVSMGCELYPARRQDLKNRQNSIDDLSEKVKDWFKDAQLEVHQQTERLYNQALKKGIAKEQARFLLPLSVTTKLYMKGSIRSWIHYIDLRSTNGTQKEHADIANAIKAIMCAKFPVVASAMQWSNNEPC